MKIDFSDSYLSFLVVENCEYFDLKRCFFFFIIIVKIVLCIVIFFDRNYV